MGDIAFLENGGGLLCLQYQSEQGWKTIDLPDPREKNFQWVLAALSVQHVPGVPGDLPEWKRQAVFDRWRGAWELPEFNDARRLAYLLDNYRAAISHDLQVYAALDVGELWRARRWMKLLDIIDRLPSHSHYAAAVAMDEEHARLLAESMASQPRGKSRGPSLTSYTPEVAILTSILDALRHNSYVTAAVQVGKKAGQPPQPSPRPETALERALQEAEYRRKEKTHNALVARMLPNKAKG